MKFLKYPPGWVGTVTAGLTILGLYALLSAILPPATTVLEALRTTPQAVANALASDTSMPLWLALLLVFQLVWMLVLSWRSHVRLFELENPKPGTGQITALQEKIILVLALHPDEGIRLEDLSQASKAEKAEVEVALIPLSKHGLVFCFRPLLQRRFELTAKGRAFASELKLTQT